MTANDNFNLYDFIQFCFLWPSSPSKAINMQEAWNWYVHIFKLGA